jgi:hypothetical protein
MWRIWVIGGNSPVGGSAPIGDFFSGTWSPIGAIVRAQGAAVDADLVSAYVRALECDPQSAFGGIVAIGGRVTPEVAEAPEERL